MARLRVVSPPPQFRLSSSMDNAPPMPLSFTHISSTDIGFVRMSEGSPCLLLCTPDRPAETMEPCLNFSCKAAYSSDFRLMRVLPVCFLLIEWISLIIFSDMTRWVLSLGYRASRSFSISSLISVVVPLG